jgi:hypothetical protein
VKHKTTARFWNRFYALPLPIQEIARRSYEILKENPRHPSLRFKNVQRVLHTLITGSAVALLWGIVPAESGAWQMQSRFPPILRCSGDLLSQGDSVARLVTLCGSPDSISRTAASSTEKPVYSYDKNGYQVQTGTQTVTRPAYETWFYNAGPGHFSYEIRVSSSIITSIEQGRYGGLR